MWFPLTFIALLAWLDWIMNRSLFFIVMVGGAAAAATLFHRELSRALNLPNLLSQAPPWLGALIRAAPPLLYLLIRGQGTSGAGWAVVLVVCGVVAAMA